MKKLIPEETGMPATRRVTKPVVLQSNDQTITKDHGLLSLLNKTHPRNKSVDRRYWSALEIMNKSGDVKKAHVLLSSAAEDGDPYSSYAMGTWYLDGFFVKKDTARAIKLFRQAADANVAYAAYDLAVCYERGEGRIRKNVDKAAMYYLRAFLFGDLQAASALERVFYWEAKSLAPRALSREFGRYLASLGK
jgi:TPR repeat protein